MELQTYVPQLNEVVAQTGRGTLAVPSAIVLWEAFEVGGNISDVGKAALAHFFFTSTDDRGVPVWKSAQIARDDNGELRLCAETWPEFCLVHLGMDKTTVSSYHRVWQIFHCELGYGLEDLIHVGVFKLKVSVGLIAKMLKEFGVVDERIKVGLFGSVQGERPLSPDAMWVLVQKVRKELFPIDDEVGAEVDFLASIEERFGAEGEVVEAGFLAQYKTAGEERFLPEWAVPVVDDDSDAEFGIRRRDYGVFKKWLMGLKGVG